MSTITLRPWQRAAFDLFSAGAVPDPVDGSIQPDFLAVATPGAGKTTFALTCARAALAEQPRPLIVVAPTSHLKTQWSLAAHRLGLELDPRWSPGDGLARDVHGLVTTYQQIATGSAATKLAGLTADGFVILDEVHHAGHEKAWGDGVRKAFGHAYRRLSLSGTPFRSDAVQIPFVRYDATGEGELAHADYTYGYGDALRDGGVVRPVYFPRVDGDLEWTTAAGDVVSASFQDELTRDQASMRLRTALSLEGEWMPSVLAQAVDRLRVIRSTPVDEGGQPDAGGLVIASDQEHAHAIARLLRDRFSVPSDVVVSDDPGASKRIEEFSTNDRPWLVSVRMVSEGVDIPRLRVGVFATTTSTELFFRQAVGRFVRWQAGRARQKAYVYIPDDPRLRAHAFSIAEARRHVLRPVEDREDDEFQVDGGLDDQTVADDAEQLALFSEFSVVHAHATAVSVHTVGADGGVIAGDDQSDEHTGVHYEPTYDVTVPAFDDEPDPPAPFFASRPELNVDLPDIPTAAGLVPAGALSVAEMKDDLRTRNAHVAKRLVDVTGWSHSKVQAEMNRKAGVSRVAAATNEQLARRLRHSESWLRQLLR
ncbi:DEAD/DEAH box helicase [Ilumatobacter nonamiensis]|uniref:DEAD/DEAH box helicase n=1 Tax=Ilumatobacter nonamiensis TaxID=467093 RepID=UPI00034B2EF9|nr:DEAD/DEAH box helicase [Ilumatobacter nonamiensis]